MSHTEEGNRQTLKPVHSAPPFSTLRTTTALILREVCSSQGRVVGGYAWVILEPTLAIMLLVAVFSAGFRTPPLGDNFAMFYASGMLPFVLFTSLTGKMGQSLRSSKQLLKYPRVTFVDVILATALLNLLTQILVSTGIFTFIIAVWDPRIVLRLPDLLLAYAMASVLGVGFGILLLCLTLFSPVFSTVWSIISRPLLLLSGVIFLHEMIPQPYRGWLEWNPLVHVVSQSRKAFYFGYHADYVSVTFVMLTGLISGAVGLLFLRAYYRDFLEA